MADRHDADAAAWFEVDVNRPGEDLPSARLLDLRPDDLRVYGCPEFAATEADGHVLDFGLCE